MKTSIHTLGVYHINPNQDASDNGMTFSQKPPERLSKALYCDKQSYSYFQSNGWLFFLALGKSLNPLSVSSSVKYIMDIYQSHQDWLFNIYKVPKGLEA